METKNFAFRDFTTSCRTKSKPIQQQMPVRYPSTKRPPTYSITRPMPPLVSACKIGKYLRTADESHAKRLRATHCRPRRRRSRLAVASGAAAITYAFENITRAGDHIVAAKTIYGGSYNLLAHTLPAYGVTTTFVDPHDLSNFGMRSKEIPKRSL